MKRVFATYFDHNYLPRALMMLRSLRMYDPDCFVFVLALTDLCQTVLETIELPKVRVVSLANLETVNPELVAVKLGRAPIDYIFTLTPFWPSYVFASADVDQVIYIDADLHFYSSPAPFLQSLGDASIAITPHNFSPSMSSKIKYGRFNVGLMTFRRCAEAQACLDQYQAECLAWCHDRVEDGKFADQGYLDAWPSRYPGLKIIGHKGVNTGPWNAENYSFSEIDWRFCVDGVPLICYHMTGLKLVPPGKYEMGNFYPEASPFLGHRILQPYCHDLSKVRKAIHRAFPSLAATELSGLR